MVSVRIVCVGKLKEKWLSDACAEYSKRLSRYCQLTVTELAEHTLPEAPGAAQIAAALEKEGADIIKACEGCYVIAACREGTQLSSEELSERMEKLSVEGHGKLAFVIGSSHGLAPSVERRADMKVSFSKLTFPHQLFRVMLLEQIYRAFSISAGAKYHK